MTHPALSFSDSLLVEPYGRRGLNRWAHPAARARRIVAVYASFYQLDPLLYGWCGLAAYVGRRVYEVLDTGVPFGRDVLEAGNLAVYRSMIPNFVAFRWGSSLPTLELAGVFQHLRVADQLARENLLVARTFAAAATLQASTYEQRHVVQPLFDRLSARDRRILVGHLGFRMGRDTASPFLQCDGDGTLADTRCAWMQETVLPTWLDYSARNEALVKADMELFRNEGRLSAACLPSASQSTA